VETSYFAQHHTEALALGRSVVEEVRAANPEASETKIRALCGAVLFSGDDVDKPVEVLSGGERARVALARMLARPANLLLLDEPTNHLDTESADVLTESLDAFEGTILFVSHNLDFARRLSTKVWDVSGGTVEIYPGTLGDYLDRMAQGRDEAGSAARGRAADLETTFAERGLEHARPGSAPPRAKPEASSKAARKAAREEKRRAEAEARKREKKARAAVEAAEAEVARLEGEKAAIEAQLAKPEVHARPEELEAASRRLGEIETALEAAMDAWTEAEAELEA
jgi:ATP-binding cassette subfamily F protein 3